MARPDEKKDEQKAEVVTALEQMAETCCAVLAALL